MAIFELFLISAYYRCIYSYLVRIMETPTACCMGMTSVGMSADAETMSLRMFHTAEKTFRQEGSYDH